jgi:aldehyde:ferredoxin oxidoreductase
MHRIRAVNNQILDVDLTSGSIEVVEVSEEDRRQYLGGKGLALKLLYDRMEPGVDPLSPDSILVMASGPTAGTASPAGGRFAVVCKSPLTGISGSSYVGGGFGLSLKKAGYGGVMVRGRSDSPVYIKVDHGHVSIEDASSLWGLDTYDLQDSRKDEGDWAVIGPAGENQVKFAVVASGRRIAGRCGLGAVMGSKRLKGLVAKGDGKVVPIHPERFRSAIKRAHRKVASHEMTAEKLRELGTAQNVMVYGSHAIMPVRNFRSPRFDNMQNISGEKIRDEHRVKNHGCVGCPIKCGITGRFRGKEMVSPQYETIALMGSNLTIGDISQIAWWNEKLNRLGLDSISTGNVIGFAMELAEKGLLDCRLVFGDPTGISEIIDDIAYRRGLGNDLAEGVKRVSEKYGGRDYAIHVKGLELPAYDPRGCTGQGLGYATANSGATHLSGSTHAIEADSYLSPHGTKGKVHFVKFMQDLTDAVNSAIFCIQTQYPFLEENFAYKYTPMPVLRLLMRHLPWIGLATADLSDYSGIFSGLMGYPITQRDFYTIGERIFNLERHMNCREGITSADDTLPPRILNEVKGDGWGTVELEKMLRQYYRLRGWDESGHPRPELLSRLGIAHEEAGDVE